MSNSFATPWTVALQVPLSLGLLRQEYWGWHFLLQGTFSIQGSCIGKQILYLWVIRKPSEVVAARTILVMMVMMMMMMTFPEYLPCTWCYTNKPQSILTTLLESGHQFFFSWGSWAAGLWILALHLLDCYLTSLALSVFICKLDTIKEPTVWVCRIKCSEQCLTPALRRTN